MTRIRQMSRAERRLWRAAMLAEPLDLRTGISAHDDVIHGKEWPDYRCIRAKVLTAILLDSGQIPKGKTPVVHLIGARITGFLELGGAEVTRILSLEQCYIEEAPDLTDARIRTIRIRESYLPGLSAVNAKIDGKLDLNGTVVDGQLRLILAHVAGEFTMNGSKLSNPDGWTLTAGGLRLDGALFGRHGFESRGPIRLVGAHLNGGAFLDDARLDGCGRDALVADNLRVEGRLVCDGLAADGAIRLPGARINGQLSWDGAMIRATGKTALDFRRLVAEELILTPTEQIEGVVDLGNARILVLCDHPSTWPKDIRLDGLIYDSLVSPPIRIGREKGHAPDLASTSADTLSSRDRLVWLSLNETGYRPQPFEQLAAFYRRIGHDDQARKVLLSKQRRRRSTLSFTGKLWGFLLDWSVGYGYRPWLAAIWLTCLVAAGTSVFARWPPPPLSANTSPHFNSLVYTINLLLPVGQFVQPDQWNPDGAERWFAYTIVGLGWLLATAVIAGVTRVLNRSLPVPSASARSSAVQCVSRIFSPGDAGWIRYRRP